MSSKPFAYPSSFRLPAKCARSGADHLVGKYCDVRIMFRYKICLRKLKKQLLNVSLSFSGEWLSVSPDSSFYALGGFKNQ